MKPDVKEQAEAIMAKLGVPASTVINMLYKQIIDTGQVHSVLPQIPVFTSLLIREKSPLILLISNAVTIAKFASSSFAH